MNVSSKSVLEDLPQPVLFQKVGDICAAVTTVMTNQELLEVSLKKTMDLFGASRGSIFILDENGHDLVLKIARGMGKDEEKSIVKRMGEGIIGQVAQLKKPIFVNDITQDQRFRDFKVRKNYLTPSFICAPLMVKDKLIGVITITDKESGSHFNNNEMQLLDFLSSQIALNYHRVELYQKFKKIIKETQNLKDKLGQSDQVTEHLKKQVFINEKLATIGKLAGGIAHEFNNPLDGVMRYTNLCIEHVGEDEVVRGYLLEIRQGLNRMANIVKNLLACSRSESSGRDKVDFKRVLDYSLRAVQTEIQHKNITIDRKIDSNIPLIRDLGLERILTNLLRNAVDAIDDGGKISIHAQCKDGELTFKVQDTGNGIPIDNVPQIFEPFFTTKDIDKGCGLGLTIVNEIVKSYDGKIDVESKLGKGSAFTIKIPVQ